MIYSILGMSSAGRTPAPYQRDFETKIRMFHKQLLQSSYGQGPGKIRSEIFLFWWLDVANNVFLSFRVKIRVRCFCDDDGVLGF